MKPTFLEWHALVHEKAKKSKLRRGQVMANLLHEIRPDINALVRGSDLDPFYLDERIPAFLDFVKENW